MEDHIIPAKEPGSVKQGPRFDPAARGKIAANLERVGRPVMTGSNIIEEKRTVVGWSFMMAAVIAEAKVNKKDAVA